MLACDGLHVRYGRVQVLHGVSLRVEHDELVAIVGPNGAGKTTLLRTIVGLLAPTAGRVTFEGRSLVGRDPALIVADGVALVPQGRMIFQSLSVGENLRLGAYRAGRGDIVKARLEQARTVFPATDDRPRVIPDKEIVMRKHALVVAVLLAVLIGVGHGPAPEAADPVKFGFSAPLTSPIAFIAQKAKFGTEYAVAELNARGGILGRP